MARILIGVFATLTIWCGAAMAQAPQADNQEATPAAAPQLTSRTFFLKFTFERNSLQGALELLSDKVNVPIEIVKDDLRINGITGCQSFGIDEQNRSLEQVLQAMLMRANLDNKLVYTVKPNSLGIDTVYIAVREEAEKRGEEIFPEFKLSPRAPAASP